VPIFDVELLSDDEPSPTLPRRLAEPLGKLLGSAPGHTWVRVRTCPRSRYAENEVSAPPPWVFVRLVLRKLPGEDELALRARAIAAIVARETGRSVEDVHIQFEEGAGRIAFGGELVRKG
jgi:hypothetical protein